MYDGDRMVLHKEMMQLQFNEELHKNTLKKKKSDLF